MTLGVLIRIALIVVIAVIIVSRRRHKQSAVNADLDHIRNSEWGGWVEIANSDYQPLFQGSIVRTAKDQAGALLLGVLVEDHAPAPLVQAIKAGTCTYLTEGRLLVRGLTAHHKNLIMTRLEDLDLMERLCALMEKGVQPETCLVLNSSEIQHMDTPEAMAQFEKVWEDSVREPGPQLTQPPACT
jgi:hypothetical protein